MIAFLFGGQGGERRLGPRPVPAAEAQPAIVAAALAAHATLTGAGVHPSYVAGHSLGELSAWCAAGGIEPDAAIEVAAERGRLMAREAQLHPGGMAALVGVGEAEVQGALVRGRAQGAVVIAAENAPDEWVLSGDHAALAAVRQARSLPVDGAWHSPAMAGAVEEYRALLRQHARPETTGPRLVVNRTGAVVAAAAAVDLLAEQLVRRVRWVAALVTLREAGVDRFVTVGPARALRSLVWRTLGTATRVMTTETPDELARVAVELA